MHRHHLTGNHWELNTLSCWFCSRLDFWCCHPLTWRICMCLCQLTTKHIERFLFHIYVGFPYLLMVNRRFTGAEAHGQCSALGWIPFMWTSGKQMQWLPSASTHETWDSSTNNCVFSRNYTWSLRTYIRGCPKRLLTYSKGPQNTPISAVPVAHLTVQTKKFRSPESDYHILVQQWRLSRTLYLNETTESHKQCENPALRQPLVLLRSYKCLLIEASPDRNTWLPPNGWMKKQSTLRIKRPKTLLKQVCSSESFKAGWGGNQLLLPFGQKNSW